MTPGDAALAAALSVCLVVAVRPWRGASRLVGLVRAERARAARGQVVSGPSGPTGRPMPSGPTRGARAEPSAADVDVDVAIVLELLAVALAAGASVPRALVVVGAAVGGPAGADLARAGGALVLGASWDEAWGRELRPGPAGRGWAPRRRPAGAAGAPRARQGSRPGARHGNVGGEPDGGAAVGGVVHACLGAAWSGGAAPGPALRATGDRLARESAARAREAAERLGVRLVVPLGACLLPAFVLVGLVPVVVVLASGLA